MKKAVGLVILAGVFCFVAESALAQGKDPLILGLGDSIGEGVQSADASFRTQPSGYLKLLAEQIGDRFPLPLIISPTLIISSGL